MSHATSYGGWPGALLTDAAMTTTGRGRDDPGAFHDGNPRRSVDEALLRNRGKRSGGDGPSDEDPVAGACRHDPPVGAAMAEAVAEGGRFRELENLHPGTAVELENHHPRTPQAAFDRFPAFRPRRWIAVIVSTHCVPRSED